MRDPGWMCCAGFASDCAPPGAEGRGRAATAVAQSHILAIFKPLNGVMNWTPSRRLGQFLPKQVIQTPHKQPQAGSREPSARPPADRTAHRGSFGALRGRRMRIAPSSNAPAIGRRGPIGWGLALRSGERPEGGEAVAADDPP